MKLIPFISLICLAAVIGLAGCAPAATPTQPPQPTSPPAAAPTTAAASNAYPPAQPPSAQTPANGDPAAQAAQAAPPGYPAPAAGTPQGKLSARLSLLTGNPALAKASPADLAKALSLPAKGPGSLILESQGRLLVDIRATDLSDAHLQELKNAGAAVANVSQTYQTVTASVAVQDLNKIAALAYVQNIQEELTPQDRGGGGGGGAAPPTAYP